VTAVLQPAGTAGRSRHPAEAVTGAVLAVLGLLAAAAAIGLLAVFGTSGRLDTGPQTIATSGSAVVSDVARLQHSGQVGQVTGPPTLRLSAVPGPASAAVFIGIGPAADVDRYLAGVAVDEVTDLTLEPFRLSVQRHAGSAAAAPPGSQSFWVASAGSPTTARLTWPVADGDYRLVVMNTDGTAGVDSRTELQLTLPHAFPIAISVLIGSVLVVLTGTALLAHGLVGNRRPDRRPTPRRTP
jgi:hypothetical protein